MNKTQILLLSCCMAAGFGAMQSCSFDDDDYNGGALGWPTAVVTVVPDLVNSSATLQLNNKTALHPVNLKSVPFGGKEVRALVNYDMVDEAAGKVHVNWMDSIRTKMPVPDMGDDNTTLYGNDPVEIVRDWTTVAEDGYLTLRLRTLWGNRGQKHEVNLLGGAPDHNALEFELRHNAFGDTYGEVADALVAFNLNEYIAYPGQPVTVKLRWMSFEGEKTAEFTLDRRPQTLTCGAPEETFRLKVM